MSKARSNITEDSLKLWFDELKKNLDELGIFDVLNDPTRVFNTDETNVQLCPDTGKVIGVKGWKNIYEIAPGTEK